MQLSVAGIDLRRTPAGVWYCFEVNASPGFTYFEEVTGQPVAEAVARLLLAGSGGHHGQAAALHRLTVLDAEAGRHQSS